MLPFGGTEIQVEYLQKYVSKDLLNKINLTTSVPEKTPILIDKTNVLWVHNSYDQPNLAPWFKNALNHRKYDWYVFNSHWTYEKYRYVYKIPTECSLVIKNGFDDELLIKQNFKKNKPIKLVYTSTPWRGLDVLLNAMEMINNEDIHLDVYSSTIIYGTAFQARNDKQFEELYNKAKTLKNVTYKGYLNHKELMKVLHTYDVYIHPSTFEETFCLSAMESLAAGLVAVITDLGALPEICGEFPIYVPYLSDKKALVKQFKHVIESLSETMACVQEEQLKFQMEYFKRYYHWNIIKNYWERFLSGI